MIKKIIIMLTICILLTTSVTAIPTKSFEDKSIKQLLDFNQNLKREDLISDPEPIIWNHVCHCDFARIRGSLYANEDCVGSRGLFWMYDIELNGELLYHDLKILEFLNQHVISAPCDVKLTIGKVPRFIGFFRWTSHYVDLTYHLHSFFNYFAFDVDVYTN